MHQISVARHMHQSQAMCPEKVLVKLPVLSTNKMRQSHDNNEDSSKWYAISAFVCSLLVTIFAAAPATAGALAVRRLLDGGSAAFGRWFRRGLAVAAAAAKIENLRRVTRLGGRLFRTRLDVPF